MDDLDVRAAIKRGERCLSPYRSFLNFLADDDHVGGLGPLLAFGYFKGNFLAFFKGAKSIADDGGIMDKNVPPSAFALNESVTLFRVEPLNSTLLQRKISSFSGPNRDRNTISQRFLPV